MNIRLITGHTSDGVMVDGREIDLSDPMTSPKVLCSAMKHLNDKVRVVAVRNPSLPIEVLCAWLLPSDGALRESDMAAWWNPSVPLAMLVCPDERYARRAFHILYAIEAPLLLSRDLRTACDAWSRCRPETESQGQAREFARRLATLFSLPWPEGP